VSFPRNPSNEILAKCNVYPCNVVDKPAYDVLVQIAKQDIPQLVGDTWTISWTIENLPLEHASENIRAYRNQLLGECDWTQFSDVTLAEDQKLTWANYRQTLRNITKQEGFPYSVVWPTKPD
jgi:hypothetical protein